MLCLIGTLCQRLADNDPNYADLATKIYNKSDKILQTHLKMNTKSAEYVNFVFNKAMILKSQQKYE